jgi:hypothetical protein
MRGQRCVTRPGVEVARILGGRRDNAPRRRYQHLLDDIGQQVCWSRSDFLLRATAAQQGAKQNQNQEGPKSWLVHGSLPLPLSVAGVDYPVTFFFKRVAAPGYFPAPSWRIALRP